MSGYDDEFYELHRAGARRSAERIVPLLLDLVSPSSVVDVGCGLGIWLSVFRERGVAEVLGLDGRHVDRSRLEIPDATFVAVDLEQRLPDTRRFDLVVSLEVAEHLRPERARDFVRDLARLGPVVAFSAAIPLQGGTHHVNEQWPDYWARLFAEHGYEVVDPIRRHVWDDESVAWWYAQNLLVFADREALSRHPKLAAEHARTARGQLSLVHPRRYLSAASPEGLSLRAVLRELPRLLLRALRSRVRRS